MRGGVEVTEEELILMLLIIMGTHVVGQAYLEARA